LARAIGSRAQPVYSGSSAQPAVYTKNTADILWAIDPEGPAGTGGRWIDGPQLRTNARRIARVSGHACMLTAAHAGRWTPRPLVLDCAITRSRITRVVYPWMTLAVNDRCQTPHP
jgi:hypothetical protein